MVKNYGWRQPFVSCKSISAAKVLLFVGTIVLNLSTFYSYWIKVVGL